MTAGSSDTVTIDGAEFYVLAEKDGNALLLSKYLLDDTRQFNTVNDTSSDHWWDSPLRDYLKDEWLPAHETLNKYAQETTITVWTTAQGTAAQSVQDKAFLFSAADVFGKEDHGRNAVHVRDKDVADHPWRQAFCPL